MNGVLNRSMPRANASPLNEESRILSYKEPYYSNPAGTLASGKITHLLVELQFVTIALDGILVWEREFRVVEFGI